MPGEERENLSPDEDAQKDEKLEDLEPGEGEGDAVKGGGGSTKNHSGSGPEELR